MHWKVSVQAMLKMIENMILTSYSDMSYFVASSDEYDASIQMMSSEKLKLQVGQKNFCLIGGNFMPWLENK